MQCARSTVEFLRHETSDLTLPNSPDINPFDYKIWGCLHERMYNKPIRDLVELKRRLVAVWADFEQKIVVKAIDHWRKLLRACIKAKGQHFVTGNVHF